MFTFSKYSKVCAFCGEEFIAYHPRTKYCPDCRDEAYRQKSRDYKKTHREELLIKQRNYYRENHELCLERARRWKRENHAFCCESRRRTYRKYAEKYRAKARKHFWENRDLINLNQRIRYYDKCVAYWNSLDNA